MNQEIKHQSLINIFDGTTMDATESVHLFETSHYFPLMENQEQHDAYIKDARKMLDEMSKRFNVKGIDRLLGALIIEFIGNAYWGKEN